MCPQDFRIPAMGGSAPVVCDSLWNFLLTHRVVINFPSCMPLIIEAPRRYFIRVVENTLIALPMHRNAGCVGSNSFCFRSVLIIVPHRSLLVPHRSLLRVSIYRDGTPYEC